MTHNCKQCNYSTDRLSSYKKHCLTKKHKSNEVSHKKVATFSMPKTARVVPNLASKKTPKNTKKSMIECEYCGKNYHDQGTLNRHLKICKDKKLADQTNKDQLISQLLEKNKQFEEEKDKLKDDLLKTNDKLLHTNDALLQANREVIKLATQMNENKGDTTTINNYNMFYIIKNFTNAHNIEDIMMPKLTDKEIKCIEDRGAVGGTYQLIKNRCIDGIDIPERPFHCIDGSRDKYLMRTEDNWSIDSMGDQILDVVFPKVRPLYDLTTEDTNELSHNAEQLTNLENGRKKIIKELNNETILKNNMKEKQIKKK